MKARNLALPSTTVSVYCVIEFDQHQVHTKGTPPKELAWSDTPLKFDVENADSEVTVWAYSLQVSGGAEQEVPLGTFSFKPALAASGESMVQWCALRRILPSDPAATGEVQVRTKFEAGTKGRVMKIDDFAIIQVIGKGSFGKVFVARKKDTNRLYAIKMLKKQYLKERGEIAHTVSERKILAKNTNPFLVSLKYSFQTPEKLYFVLDYVNGGELFVHLQREGCFSESRSRLYAAMLISALDHLHQHNIVYRDLKPENILIDMNGLVLFCAIDVPVVIVVIFTSSSSSPS